MGIDVYTILRPQLARRVEVKWTREMVWLNAYQTEERPVRPNEIITVAAYGYGYRPVGGSRIMASKWELREDERERRAQHRIYDNREKLWAGLERPSTAACVRTFVNGFYRRYPKIEVGNMVVGWDHPAPVGCYDVDFGKAPRYGEVVRILGPAVLVREEPHHLLAESLPRFTTVDRAHKR